MKLILDNREHALIESCQKTANNFPNISLEVETLALGDALIKTEEGKEVLCIERKTIPDLLASIKDGRYEEQSHRLENASHLPTHHILYIIEGFLSSVTPQEKRLVLSTITSLNVFKGFSVMKTANVHETAELLLTMVDKIGRDFTKGRVPLFWKEKTESMDIENYSSFVKKVKKENLTPANMAEIVLCQIPGISNKTASAIIAKFTVAKGACSLLNILQILQQDPAFLEDIVMENGRKINKTISSKIMEYLIQ
jgi:ERCC4-type nuclease